MKPTHITAQRRPDCPKCVDGWICEAHPDNSWPHDDCAGPGRPCDAPGCAQKRLDREQRFGWLGTPSTQPERTGTLLDVLLRIRARRVVTAALYTRPAGTELRVFFEPEANRDLLHSQVERFDVGRLEDRAAAMRQALREKGWLELPANGPDNGPLH